MRRALLWAALPLAACAEPDPNAPLLTVAVSPTPAIVGTGRVLVTLSDPSGLPLEGATVILNGRAPGGAEPVVDTAEEQAPGSYAVGDFPFDRPGDWTLEAVARLPDGRETARDHPILVVGRPAPR